MLLEQAEIIRWLERTAVVSTSSGNSVSALLRPKASVCMITALLLYHQCHCALRLIGTLKHYLRDSYDR